MRILLILIFFVTLAFVGCQKSTVPSETVTDMTNKTPTATEIFNLRSKCAELGEEIMRRNRVEPGMTQDNVSHYDPKTNRCYVELDINMADQTKFEDHHARYLYDGQTGEILAFTDVEKGVRRAHIMKDSKSLGDFIAASNEIDRLRADDRKH